MRDIDRAVYRAPSPAAVAALWLSHGRAACAQRWHWLDQKSITDAVRIGLAHRGHGEAFSRRRSAGDPARELAAVETAYQLQRVDGARKAAGLSEAIMAREFTTRGIPSSDRPKAGGSARAQATLEGRRANRGDAAAAARIAARAAHDRAVFGVVLAALALVPDQPATGRPRLPEPSDALRNALAGHDVGAVEAVFTGLLKESERIR